MLLATVAAAGVPSTYAPPATVFLQREHFQMPTECLLTEFLPQNTQLNCRCATDQRRAGGEVARERRGSRVCEMACRRSPTAPICQSRTGRDLVQRRGLWAAGDPARACTRRGGSGGRARWAVGTLECCVISIFFTTLRRLAP